MGAGPAGGQAGPGYHPNHSEGQRWTGPGMWQGLGGRGKSLTVGPAGGHAGPDVTKVSFV